MVRAALFYRNTGNNLFCRSTRKGTSTLQAQIAAESRSYMKRAKPNVR
jgi:hypothetical protein